MDDLDRAKELTEARVADAIAAARRCGRHFRIVFEGLLTEELMRDAGLPLYRVGVP